MHWTQLWNWNALRFEYCDPVIWFCTLPIWSPAFSKACFTHRLCHLWGGRPRPHLSLPQVFCLLFPHREVYHDQGNLGSRGFVLVSKLLFITEQSRVGRQAGTEAEFKEETAHWLTDFTISCLTQPGTCCLGTVPPTVGTLPPPHVSHQSRQRLTDLSRANLTDAVLQLGFPLPRWLSLLSTINKN